MGQEGRQEEVVASMDSWWELLGGTFFVWLSLRQLRRRKISAKESATWHNRLIQRSRFWKWLWHGERATPTQFKWDWVGDVIFLLVGLLLLYRGLRGLTGQ